MVSRTLKHLQLTVLLEKEYRLDIYSSFIYGSGSYYSWQQWFHLQHKTTVQKEIISQIGSLQVYPICYTVENDKQSWMMTATLGIPWELLKSRA